MDFEDMYQELQITLLKCCEVVNSGKITTADDICGYVCQALRNRADTMFRHAHVQKREGITVEIDLTTEFEVFHSRDFDDMHSRILQEQMRHLLKGLALDIFNVLMEPSKALLESCEKSALRKAHLKKSNPKVRGADVFRIYKWNVMDALNLGNEEFQSALGEIHSAYKTVVAA